MHQRRLMSWLEITLNYFCFINQVLGEILMRIIVDEKFLSEWLNFHLI